MMLPKCYFVSIAKKDVITKPYISNNNSRSMKRNL